MSYQKGTSSDLPSKHPFFFSQGRLLSASMSFTMGIPWNYRGNRGNGSLLVFLLVTLVIQGSLERLIWKHGPAMVIFPPQKWWRVIEFHPCFLPSLKLTAKAPKNGWLEYDPFLLGKTAYFQGLLPLVSGRVSSGHHLTSLVFLLVDDFLTPVNAETLDHLVVWRIFSTFWMTWWLSCHDVFGDEGWKEVQSLDDYNPHLQDISISY